MFAALPASSQVFFYDADGDAIMTDANTGLPIGFAGRVRARSASLDTESVDEPLSKRSRSSSEEEGEVRPRRGSTGTLIASPLPDDEHDGGAAPAPPAPKKASPAPVLNPEDNQDGDGAESAVRNLAEAMAEAVLHGEPRDGAAEGPVAAGAGPNEEGFENVEADDGEWCLGLRCNDLALRLDMRHPRVVLNFLRFVESYNELAPHGEEIHVPYIPQEQVAMILNHDSVVNPPPEFAEEVAELRSLVARYSCHCSSCSDDGYSTDSDDRGDYYCYDRD